MELFEKKKDSHKKEHFISRRRAEIVIGIILVFLFGMLAYLFGFFSFTGGVVGELTSGGGVAIKADLSLSGPLDFTEEAEKIGIQTTSSKDIFIDDKRFGLPGADNTIEIKAYDGKFLIDESNIFLDGAATLIYINGVRIGDGSSTLKVFFEESFSYEMVEIDSVFLPSHTEQPHGEILVGGEKGTLIVEGEEVKLGDFFGDVAIIDGRKVLTGNIEGLSVEGSVKTTFGSV